MLKAAPNHNTSDLMAAQVLLQSATTMLTEALKMQKNIKELLQSNKKLKVK